MTKLTYNNAIKPLLIFGKCLGLVCFKINKKGYEKSKPNTILNAALILLYIGLTVDSLIQRSILQLTSLLLTTTDIMQVTTACVQISVSWTICALYQDKFISILTRMASIDRKFNQLGIFIYYEQLYKSAAIRLCAHFLLVVTSTVVQMVVYPYTMEYMLISFNITFYFPLFINMGVVELMSSLNNLLKCRFVTLNEHLVDLQKQDGAENQKISNIKLTNVLGTKLSTLRIICPIHHELTKIAKLIDEAFGVMLLMSFGVGFVTIIVSLYDCSLTLQNMETTGIKALVGPLAMSTTYIFDCLYLCYNCHSTVEEANTAGRLLHQIDTEDEEVKDQIEMFSLQIVNEKLEYSAAGFFPVNYSLVFSIIGGITTYLIILIQFSATPNQKST